MHPQNSTKHCAKKHSKWVIAALLLLLGSFSSNAITITGTTTPCAGIPYSYTTSGAYPTGTVTLLWTITTSGGNIIGSNTGTSVDIQWTAGGTQTINLSFYNASGAVIGTSLTSSVFPQLLPTPYITTSTILACQELEPDPNDEVRKVIADDGGGCIKVCKGSTVTYYANNYPTSSTFLWTPTNGTVVSATATGSSVDILWDGAIGSSGNIALTVTTPTPYGCSVTKNVCTETVESPIASFCIWPSTTPAPTTGSTTICAGDEVHFWDLSTPLSGASPILNWFWDFGDGEYSTLENPDHPFTRGAGDYTVVLVVTNACGCQSKYTTVITVDEEEGPQIDCAAGVVCENSTVKYSTSTSCTTYNWGISGDGTILSGSGTNSIIVKWNSVEPDGVGWVSLTEPGCSGCPGTTVLKVPIVQSNPTVAGPTGTVCTDREYKYSIPLWPGTRYHWGVIGHPTYIMGEREANEVAIQFPATGSYTVHVWWENSVGLCGGDKKFTVNVGIPTTITGPDIECNSTSDAYTLSGTSSVKGYWTQIAPGGIPDVGTSLLHAKTMVFPFAVDGVFVISVNVTTSGYCSPDPIYVTSVRSPGNVSSTALIGETTVCTGLTTTTLGPPYTYSTLMPPAIIPAESYGWSIVGGVITSAPDGTTITARWYGGSITRTLKVWRTMLTYPYCTGAIRPFTINDKVVSLTMTGNTTPCANSTQTYSCTYTGADVYTWTLSDPTLGSIVSGQNTPTCTVKWNNPASSSTCSVNVTVSQCNKNTTGTRSVTISPIPNVSLSGCPSEPICSNENVVGGIITATQGAEYYKWDFGDGTVVTETTSVNPLAYQCPNHTYNTAMGGSTETYILTVTASGAPSTPISGYPCGLTGSATCTLTVLPSLSALISYNKLKYCVGESISTTFSIVVSEGVGSSYTINWYEASAPTTSIGTGTPFTVTTTGNYFAVISYDDAICDPLTTAVFVVYTASCPELPSDCGSPIALSPSVSCNSFTVTETPPTGATGSPTWTYPGGYTSMSTTSTSITLTYPHIGFYNIGCTQTIVIDGVECTAIGGTTVKVPYKGDFRYSWLCDGTSNYGVLLDDYSEFMPGWALSGTQSWTISGPGITGSTTVTGMPYSYYFPSNGTYTVTYVSTASDGTETQTCTTSHTIVVPVKPTLTFTANPTSICEDAPITFTYTGGPTANVVSYLWTFSDPSSLLTTSTIAVQKAYDWNPTAWTGLTHVTTNTLSITDIVGCTFASSSVPVTIYKNQIDGNLGSDVAVCSGTPVTLTYTITGSGVSPYSYAWSNGPIISSNTINVYNTGAYYVTVTDAVKCWKSTTPTSTNVTIYPAPPAVITGKLDYCSDEQVKLDGYAGGGTYAYQWYIDGVASVTTHNYTPATITAGSHTAQVQITFTYADPAGGTFTCSDISPVTTFTIHTVPTVPIITGPIAVDCSQYLIELDGSHPSSATTTFNWSDGTSGMVMQTHNDGGYRLYFTDAYGCRSYTDALIPESPERGLAWFPVGCFDLCKEQVPFYLYGPPYSYENWEWIKNSTTDASGVDFIAPYYNGGSGVYNLMLDNGLCSMTSKDMTISEHGCSCGDPFSATTTISCSSTDPHGYDLVIHVNTSVVPVGTVIDFSFDFGPVYNFEWTVTTGGTTTLHVTTLVVPTPSSGILTAHWFNSSGSECLSNKSFSIPTCTGTWWTNEKPGPGVDSTLTQDSELFTSLMVFPNPAQNHVQVQYHYAAPGTQQRSIDVFDVQGRLINRQVITDFEGKLDLPVSDWSAGTYLIRMQENNQMLHTDQLIITH